MENQEIYQDLIIRYLDGSASEAETRRLFIWLRTDDVHMQEFIIMRDIWEASGRLSVAEKNRTAEALEKFRHRIKIKKKERTGIIRILMKNWQVAAILMVFLISAIFLFNLLPVRNSNVSATFNKTIIPKGQKGQLILADGTKVWLNSGTVLCYPSTFGKKTREVYLEGEAYFDVVHNSAKPFQVHSGDLIIKVLGTSFNLKSYPGDNSIETTLVKGSVKILKKVKNIPEEVITLKPNEKAVYDRHKNQMEIIELTEEKPKSKEGGSSVINLKSNNSDIIKPVKQRLDTEIEWKDQKLIFENESLEEMVKRLERWYNKNIYVESEKLKKNHYSGKFIYNETIYQVLDVICRSTQDMTYYEKNHEIYISAK